MSTPVTHPGPPRAGLAASLECDDAGVRADVLALFAAAGIGVTPGADAIVVLALAASPASRLEHCRAVVALQPAARVILAMPAACARSSLRRALRLGVHGIVFDEDLMETLVPTLRAVHAGQLAVPAALRRQLAPPALSFREKQILNLVVAGYTNRQIAGELFVAESTVKTHLSSAFTKLDARSRAEAAALILDPEEGYGPAFLAIAANAATRAA